MPIVEERIPNLLRGEVDAALSWWNAREDSAFEVTGIVDPADTLAQQGARTLRLVLCGGDRCEQRSFHVAPAEEGFEVSLLAGESPASAVGETIQPELDPPPGARRGWLDRALGAHAFVVLVFYRGYW